MNTSNGQGSLHGFLHAC